MCIIVQILRNLWGGGVSQKITEDYRWEVWGGRGVWKILKRYYLIFEYSLIWNNADIIATRQDITQLLAVNYEFWFIYIKSELFSSFYQNLILPSFISEHWTVSLWNLRETIWKKCKVHTLFSLTLLVMLGNYELWT